MKIVRNKTNVFSKTFVEYGVCHPHPALELWAEGDGGIGERGRLVHDDANRSLLGGVLPRCEFFTIFI